MSFHRFVTPTYFGGLPAGYDLINVVSGGTGAGGSAFADGAKAGGPNVGSYFVAFGEDATSSNANRGMKALVQNTDALDDLMRRDLASPIRTANATAVGTVSSITLPTNTFIGVAGYTTSTADLNRLFEVTDGNDNEIIINSSGAKVQVTSVTLGGGDTIGGGGGNGSFSGNTVQLNLSPGIPNGTVYRVYYATRSNLATMPVDTFTTIKIRGAQEVEAAVEDLFRLLHGNTEAWNASWDSTIFDLAMSGLDARYRCATTSVTNSPPDDYFTDPPAFNDPFSGSYILRDGPAVTVTTGEHGSYLDPYNSLFVGKFYDVTQANSGGAVGYTLVGSRLSGTALAGEKTYQPGTASFLSLWQHVHTNALHVSNPYTRIPTAASVTLSSPTVNANTGESVVTLNTAGHYFRQSAGSTPSAIALGYDMLELRYTKGGIVFRQTVVIVAMGSSADPTNVAKVRIRNLDGSVPDFTGTSAATIIKWHSTTFAVGDGMPQYHKQTYSYSDDVKIGGLFFQVPQKMSSNAGDDNVPRTPMTASAMTATSTDKAFQWGGFQYIQPSGPIFLSFLRGDGSFAVGGAGDSEFNTTSKLHFKTGTRLQMDTGSLFQMDAGSGGSLNGDISMNTGATFDVADGALMTVNDSGMIAAQSGGTIQVEANSFLNLLSTSLADFKTGSIANFYGRNRRSAPFIMTAANHTLNQAYVGGAQYLKMDATGAGAATIVLTLPDAGNTLGDWFRMMFLLSTSFTGHIEIVRQTPSGGGALVCTLQTGRFGQANGTSPYNWSNTVGMVEVEWDGTKWVGVGAGDGVAYGVDWN